MKRLVVCSDGTWNSPEQKHPTNVLKMARMVTPSALDGTPQVVFYDQGVGTGNWVDRWIGGITGKGLSKNIQDAYRFLMHNYEDGDEVDKAYELYRRRDAGPKSNAAVTFRSSYSREIEVKFVGVWETVGLLGIPLLGLRFLTHRKYRFHDLELSRSLARSLSRYGSPDGTAMLVGVRLPTDLVTSPFSG